METFVIVEIIEGNFVGTNNDRADEITAEETVE